jgi:hypothetical protein
MRPADIALLLPEVYRAGLGEDTALDALLAVMSALHGSLEDAIADPSRLVDPRRAPERLVGTLAEWTGLSRYLDDSSETDADWPYPGDLRELTALAAQLGRRRGSRTTLVAFLEAATGITGFSVDEVPEQPFHFTVTVPDAAAGRRDLVLKIITAEKPAFATFELVEATRKQPH